jgi:hypothetical protein
VFLFTISVQQNLFLINAHCKTDVGELNICIHLFAVDEMYLASLINKGREVYANGTTDPTALPAETVLSMVTLNGAKSVLWDNEIGSLEVGKKVGQFSQISYPFLFASFSLYKFSPLLKFYYFFFDKC